MLSSPVSPVLQKNKALKFRLFCQSMGQKNSIFFLEKAVPGWCFNFKAISVCFVHFAIIFTGLMGMTCLGVVKTTEIKIKMILVKYFLSQCRHLKSYFFPPLNPAWTLLLFCTAGKIPENSH